MGALAIFLGGALALALFDPARIGVFLSVTALSAFAVVGDLGLTYSLLLAASSRPPEQAGSVGRAALAAALPTVPVTSAVLFLGGAALLLKGNADAGRWLWPWIAFCAISGIQLVLTLALAYVEGTGRRHAVWRANFWIEIAASTVFVGLIAFQQELWAIAAAVSVRSVLLALILFFRFEFPALAGPGSLFALWREELWPMQWKSLLNSLAVLLTTRLLTPILLAVQGAAAAGQIGLVLVLTYLMAATASVLPLSQTALYASLYYQGRSGELKQAFRRTFTIGTALAVLFFAGAGIACSVIREYSPYMAARLPQIPVIWLVLAITPISYVTNCFAIAIRSQRADPGVIPNLLLTVPSMVIIWFAARHSALAFSVTYLVTTTTVAVMYGYLFWRFVRHMPRTG
ncbi:hypothetical protein [Emcibacter sp. SYSU 3D8]|uniref:hypothetical protein n=1 Tax=Emcibacter sp. SYSU 3D8 TaxID=3133969 RepID=UPI0031FE495C